MPGTADKCATLAASRTLAVVLMTLSGRRWPARSWALALGMGRFAPTRPTRFTCCLRTAAGRPICSCELSLDWRDGVVVPDHVMGGEAGLDPPQPTVGVLGPQCGPQPRSEPGRPSVGAALFRCPATSVSRPANDAGFPPHHAAWSAAVSATPKWPPIWRFRQPPTPGHVQRPGHPLTLQTMRTRRA